MGEIDRDFRRTAPWSLCCDTLIAMCRSCGSDVRYVCSMPFPHERSEHVERCPGCKSPRRWHLEAPRCAPLLRLTDPIN